MRSIRTKRASRKAVGGEAGAIFRAQLSLLVSRDGSQAAFARRHELSVQTVNDWLHGGKTLPGFEMLAELSQRLGVSLDWLVFGIGPEKRNVTRTTEALDADVGEYVIGEASRGKKWQGPWVDDLDRRAYGEAVLAFCAEQVAREFEVLFAAMRDKSEADKAFQALRIALVSAEYSQDPMLASIKRTSLRLLHSLANRPLPSDLPIWSRGK